MAKETVRRFIASYKDEHVYSWVMDWEDILVGTIGAYDYENDQIEVGFSVVPAWQGKGYASEALTEVMKYLSENENIPCIKAWCAAENIGSKRVLEKAGMTYVSTEKNGIDVNEKTYDKLNFEYRK
jgi:RimJ/RimL family protein N-acetyltransferase